MGTPPDTVRVTRSWQSRATTTMLVGSAVGAELRCPGEAAVAATVNPRRTGVLDGQRIEAAAPFTVPVTGTDVGRGARRAGLIDRAW